MKKEMIQYINQTILHEASKISYIVSDIAPNNEIELFNQGSTITVWSGGSDNTIFGDARVNYAFRALHDALHIKTRLGFTHAEEYQLGKLQASQYDSDLMSTLVYCEVVCQAKYHETTGLFVVNQVEFTNDYMKSKGY